LVGGQFNVIGGQVRNNIAKLNNTTGSADLTWNPNFSSTISAISIYGTDIYVGGYFTSVGGQSRNYLAKININSGTPDIWNPNSNYFLNAICLSGNQIYVGGNFSGISGTVQCHFVRFIDNLIVGNQEVPVETKETKVFPDPASYQLFIQSDMTKDGNLSVYNINGQEVLHENVNQNQTVIDVSNFKSGIYFVRLQNAKSVSVQKFVKE
jgi:hypothetical protein